MKEQKGSGGRSGSAGRLVWLVCFSLMMASPVSAVDLLSQGLPSAIKAAGGSGLASQDGLAGWLLNPALNSQNKFPGFTSVYSGLNGDASVFGLGLVYPTALANFALDYIEADSDSFIHTRMGGGGIEVLDEFSYNDRWLVLAASKNINQAISVGGQIKYIKEGFSGSYGSGQGYSSDFGLLGKISDKIQFGLVAQNFLLRKISWSGSNTETLPTHYKAGLGLRALANLFLTLDGDYCSSYPLVLKAGADWTVNDWLDLRAGVIQQPISPGETETGYTLGLGLNLDDLSFDYAYCPGLILEETTAHYFSLSYRFAPPAVQGQSGPPAEAPVVSEIKSEAAPQK